MHLLRSVLAANHKARRRIFVLRLHKTHFNAFLKKNAAPPTRSRKSRQAAHLTEHDLTRIIGRRAEAAHQLLQRLLQFIKPIVTEEKTLDSPGALKRVDVDSNCPNPHFPPPIPPLQHATVAK
jgi:hypothetical protein